MSRTRAAAPLLAVLLYALALRLYGLGDLPLWLDESFSHWSASQSWTDLYAIVPRIETHPMAWYSLLKLWRVFGEREAAMRALPMILGVAALIPVYFSGKMLGGRWCGVLAALLLACAPLQIAQSQNLRPYTFLTFASAIAVWAALYIVRHPSEAALPLWRMRLIPAKTMLAYAGLALGWALLAWAHNLGVLLAASIGLFLACFWLAQGRSMTMLANLLIALAVAIALYAPNIAVLLHQYAAVNRGWWLVFPPRWEVIFQTTELFGFPIYGISPRANSLLNAALILPFAAGAVIAIFGKGRSRPSFRVMCALLVTCAFGPWIATLAISKLLVPIFMQRTLIMVQVPAVLLLATAAVALSRLPKLRARLGFLLLAAIPIGVSLSFHARDTRAEAQDRRWDDIAAHVHTLSPGAKVFTLPNAVALPLAYYADKQRIRLDVVPLPAPYPAFGFARYLDGGGGTPAVQPATVMLVADRAKGHREAWLITRGVHLYDPSGVIARQLGRLYPCKQAMQGFEAGGWIVATRYYGSQPRDCR